MLLLFFFFFFFFDISRHTYNKIWQVQHICYNLYHLLAEQPHLKVVESLLSAFFVPKRLIFSVVILVIALILKHLAKWAHADSLRIS
jgi:hypothetical protein